MKINEKGFTLKFFLILVLVNVSVYALYHVSYLMDYNWFEYIHIYIAEIWEFLFVPICTVVMLKAGCKRGWVYSLKIAATSIAARVFYTIPFYYMEFMRNSYPPNSFDSIILSIIYTVFEMLVTLAHFYVICGFIFWVCRVRGKGNRDYLASALIGEADFDFSTSSSLVLLIVCLVQFAIKLIGLISDTVSFFIEFGGGYTLAEILVILFDYVVCIGLLPLSYIAICRLKKEFLDEQSASDRVKN